MADRSIPVAIGVALPTHVGILATRMMAGEGWRLVEVPDVDALAALGPGSGCVQVWWGPGVDPETVDAQLARWGYAGRRAPMPSPLDLPNLRASLGLPPPPLDRAALARLAEDLGDVQLVRDLVNLFLQSLATRWQDTQQAWQSGDAEAARRSAHTLKSSAALLGLTPLAGVFSELEQLAREDRVAEAAERGHLVGPALDRAIAALTDWLASP